MLSVSGDFNGDLAVDAADYPIWRKTLNSAVPPSSGADADGNGKIEAADYNLWRASFGAGSTDLELSSIIDLPDPVVVGDTVRYTIAVVNQGSRSAQEVTLRYTAGLGLRILSISSPDEISQEISPNGITGKSVFALIHPGQVIMAQVVCRAEDGGHTATYDTQFLARVLTATGDESPANDLKSVTTTIKIESADLKIESIVDNPDSVHVGSPVTYTITMTNLGPDTSRDVELYLSGGGGLTIREISVPQGTVDIESGICVLGSIPSGATLFIHCIADADAAGGNVNFVTPFSAFISSAITADPDSSNNLVSDNTTIIVSGSGTHLASARLPLSNAVRLSSPQSMTEEFFLGALRNRGLSPRWHTLEKSVAIRAFLFNSHSATEYDPALTVFEFLPLRSYRTHRQIRSDHTDVDQMIALESAGKWIEDNLSTDVERE